MARIRTIKPEFFTSEDIVEMPPLARLLYIALWCEADKEGRFAWKPKTFKMRYLPADECDIDAICDALLTRGLIVIYGDGLACIPSFKNHQHINPREKDSVLPPPTPEELTRERRVNHASVTHREEGRKEGKGKEGKGILMSASAEALPDVAVERRQGVLDAIEETLDSIGSERAVTPAQQATAVFEHWKQVMDSPRSVFDDKRQGFIKKALKMGYGAEDLCAAIDGCRKSPHHMGQNDRGTKYNTIDLIFRDADHIDKFIVIGRSPLVQAPPARQNGSGRPDAYRVAHLDHSGTDAMMQRTITQRGIEIPPEGDISFDD